MSIDIYLELGEAVSEAELRDGLAAAGATITSNEPAKFSGSFPGSGMAFFFDAFPVPHRLRAEGTQVRMSVAAELWLRPRPSTYDEAMAELRALSLALASRTAGGFIMSDQYEAVYAERDQGAVRLFAPLDAADVPGNAGE
jgi:hypothetical protein